MTEEKYIVVRKHADGSWQETFWTGHQPTPAGYEPYQAPRDQAETALREAQIHHPDAEYRLEKVNGHSATVGNQESEAAS